MLHPARSINPYHKAPRLKMECTDVPLIERQSEGEREGVGGGKRLEDVIT